MRMLGIVLVAAASAVAPTLAAGDVATIDVALERLRAPDAATALRSIAGVQEVEVVDDHVVRLTDDAETLAVAEVVIELAESPSTPGATIPTHALSDGSVIAAVRLAHSSPADVMTELRRLSIAHIVASTEPPMVMVRDTVDQVEAALNRIRQLESRRE